MLTSFCQLTSFHPADFNTYFNTGLPFLSNGLAAFTSGQMSRKNCLTGLLQQQEAETQSCSPVVHSTPLLSQGEFIMTESGMFAIKYRIIDARCNLMSDDIRS